MLDIDNVEGIGGFFKRFAIDKRQFHGQANGILDGHLNGKVSGNVKK